MSDSIPTVEPGARVLYRLPFGHPREGQAIACTVDRINCPIGQPYGNAALRPVRRTSGVPTVIRIAYWDPVPTPGTWDVEPADPPADPPADDPEPDAEPEPDPEATTDPPPAA
jgi:hypothetical protein